MMDKTTLDAVAAVLKGERQSIETRLAELQGLIESKANDSAIAIRSTNEAMLDGMVKMGDDTAETVKALEARLTASEGSLETLDVLKADIEKVSALIEIERVSREASEKDAGKAVSDRLAGVSDAAEKAVADVSERLDTVAAKTDGDVASLTAAIADEKALRETSEKEADEAVAREINNLSDDIEKAIGELSERLGNAELRVELARDHSEAFARIDKAVEDYTRDFSKAYLDEKVADVQKQVDAKLESIVDGQDGQDGRDGRDGADGVDGCDGIDKQLVQPVEVSDEQSIPKGHVVYHKGGLFQSTRDVVGSPDRDPHGYSCIVDGISNLSKGVDRANGTVTFEAELSTGKKASFTFDRMPSYLPPGEHRSIEGDYYLDGTVLRLYKDSEWLEVDLKGARGRKGYKGDDGEKGDTGAAGVGIDDIIVEKNMMFVTLDNGEVKEFLIDIAGPQGEDIDQEIKRYAGEWHVSKSYSQGDVITAYDGLWLCTKNTSDRPNGGGDAWALMHSGGGGGGGAGGSGGLFGWPPTVISLLNMQGFAIRNLAPPVNPSDAATKSYVDSKGGSVVQSIANTTAYNGITGTQNVKLSSKFPGALPSAGDVVTVGYNAAATDNSAAGIYRYDGVNWSRVVDFSSGFGGGGAGVYSLNAHNVALLSGTASDLAGALNATPTLITGVARSGDIAVAAGGSAAEAKFNGGVIYDGTNWKSLSGSVDLTKFIYGYIKALKTDPDPATAGVPQGSISVTSQGNKEQIKVMDGAGNWQLVYDKEVIDAAIAASRSFKGTAVEAGNVQLGSVAFNTLPSEATLTKAFLGSYWTYTGTDGHVIGAGEIGGAASAVDGSALTPGDWLQVANVGTATAPVYQYVIIHGDNLSAARANKLFGHQTWVDGAWESGSIVSYRPSPTAPIHYYKASANVTTGDLAPGVTGAGNPWVDITPEHALDDLIDVDLATTPPVDGDSLTYDAASLSWVPSYIGSPKVFVGTAPINMASIDAPNNYGMDADTVPSPGTFTPRAGDTYIATQDGSIATMTSAAGGQGIADGATVTALDIVRSSLDELDDVTITTPVADQVLKYDLATTKWLNWTPDYLTPTTGYTKTEVDTKLSTIITGISHGVSVVDFISAPPVAPVTDEFYLIKGPVASGAWNGHENSVAYWDGVAWQFQVPQANESHLNEANNFVYHWNATAWVKVAVGQAPQLVSDLTMIGDIKQSMLTETQFIGLLPAGERTKWVLADGRNVTGSAYATATGDNTIPDLRGAFLRVAGQNNNANWTGGAHKSYNEDTTRRPRNTDLTGTAASAGNHRHSYRVQGYGGTAGSHEMELVANNVPHTKYTEYAGSHTHQTRITGGGDTETAPKNYAVNHFIKIN